jgi:hypothetical protein
MNLKNTLSKYSTKPNSLFKKIFVIFSFAYLPFLVLFSILASFSIMPVNFNGEDVYGLIRSGDFNLFCSIYNPNAKRICLFVVCLWKLCIATIY